MVLSIDEFAKRLRGSAYPSVEYANMLSEHYSKKYSGDDLKEITRLRGIFSDRLFWGGVVTLIVQYPHITGGFKNMLNLLTAILKNTVIGGFSSTQNLNEEADRLIKLSDDIIVSEETRELFLYD